MIASNAIGDSLSFYLHYMNRSRASAPRGPMGWLRRTLVEHKGEDAIDSNLRQIKARLEAL